MSAAPAGKIFVDKLAILTQQGVGKNRKGHHVFAADLADNIHKSFFILDDAVDFINHKGAIREGFTTKDGLQVGLIHDGEISKGALVDAQVRLIKLVDNALELLVTVIFRGLNVITGFDIFFPEIIGINQEAGQAASATAAIGGPADKLTDKIREGGQVLGRLGVKVVNKIKALIDKFLDIISKAIGDKGT